VTDSHVLEIRGLRAGVAGSDCGDPSSSENVVPCFQHSISRSSWNTSPSASE
jgi:hypothetical protein